MELYTYGKETVGNDIFGRSILGCLFGKIESDVMDAAHTYLMVSVFSLSVAALEMAVTVLRCFSIAALPIWPLSFTLPNALRGAGDAKFTMIVSILSMWICRIVICYILVMWCDFGILGVWLRMFLDWYVRGISYSLRYLSKKWLTKKVI